MVKNRHVFGPVPSRRLGVSLGVSPIPEKTCNYTCTYCQLGRTRYMSNKRTMFYPVDKIAAQVQAALKTNSSIDVISLVGEGEPTLYEGLGDLIDAIKSFTDKPVVLITNAALFYDKQVRHESAKADIVLPSLDGYDETSWKTINRPYGRLDYKSVLNGLIEFSKEYGGQLWLEIMLIRGENDSDKALKAFSSIVSKIRHDRLYVNTPVRPPAEGFVEPCSHERVRAFAKKFNGSAIDELVSIGFGSDIKDNYEAVCSIIMRHPMNAFEIESFLKSRHASNTEQEVVFSQLKKDGSITAIEYKGFVTYRAS
ncbi:MAG TPA: radical SAM protein [Treponemataceae bacterium]|nr:radical SAM protein [Treponemataceae bacterium]